MSVGDPPRDAAGPPGGTLLRGLDLALRAGERVAVTGPSGSGKTTLLRAIAGLIDPSEGAVTLEGRAPAEWGWPTFRRRVGYVAQRPALIDASVEANLARPFTYAVAAGAAFPRERAVALLGRLGLTEEVFAQSARTLSVGQQQRVALARALLVEPRVLLLDEPTSALDPESVAGVLALLRGWVAERGAGRAMLLVTHDPAQADGWADRRIDLGPYLVAAPQQSGARG